MSLSSKICIADSMSRILLLGLPTSEMALVIYPSEENGIVIYCDSEIVAFIASFNDRFEKIKYYQN